VRDAVFHAPGRAGVGRSQSSGRRPRSSPISSASSRAKRRRVDSARGRVHIWPDDAS
jgi:hypothetical protein